MKSPSRHALDGPSAPDLFSDHARPVDLAGDARPTMVWVIGRLMEGDRSPARRGVPGKPSKRWYGWPAHHAPLDAVREGIALGPFDTKAEARAATLRRIADLPNAELLERREPRRDEEETPSPPVHRAQWLRPARSKKGAPHADDFEVHEGADGRCAVYIAEHGLAPPGRLIEMVANRAAAARLTQGRGRLHPFDAVAHAATLATERAAGERYFNLRPDFQAPVWTSCTRIEVEGCDEAYGAPAPAAQAALFRLVVLRLDHDVEFLACFSSLDEADAVAGELSAMTGLRVVDAVGFGRNELNRQYYAPSF